ncbi:pyridoxamine 5'-phosphate oxidase family protein [Mahella australiensis]|uniref:Pyridoxamine 5'-phosphate oxidase-related FMN-binding protein n=1 Tax=Mahella australiensis (strain DSM 15567 / CIP 107919 / 50-1 BON) TaxID=697281 RepID=F4A217_MAHA5|nr:pyridoxamine 5'-phosphate oxidase family protein [Mahella australiensis]AEE97156.1 pyridoxamine 5'-phosphate oxidase-related FMN-binding protein [Mahella australiensis 50-1 BON]
MFKDMRRKDRNIDNKQAIKLLESGQFGILSTVGENGYAYGAPLNYVYHDGSIYFHSAVEGSKLDNIKYNNKISFCVVGNTEPLPDKFSYRYESVIVFGRAIEVFDKEKENALLELVQKYSKAFIEEGIKYIEKNSINTKVIKISIEHMTGKARR